MKTIWGSIAVALLVTLAGLRASAATSDEEACWSYVSAGDWPRAVDAGRRAVAAQPVRGAHLCLGRAYRGMGELESALVALKETERLSTTDSELATVASWLGSVYANSGNLENAELYYSRALSLARKAKDRSSEATELNNLANVFSSRGLYEKSLKYYREALTLEKTDAEKATVYGNIAVAELAAGRGRASIPWFEKAIAAHERAGDHQRASTTRLNLGDAYRQLNDHVPAEKALSDGLAAVTRLSDQLWESIGYQYLGLLRRDQKKVLEARDLFDKSQELAARIGAKDVAQRSRRLRDRMQHAAVARTFSGVEIGAKGVKVLSIELKEPLEGGYVYHSRLRKTENTNLLSELRNGAARPEAVEATAKAAAGFVRQLQREVGIPTKDIYVLGSSGAGRITNRAALAARVKQLAGVNVEFVSERQEAVSAFLGAVPADMWDTAVVVDIGSGNTKIAYSYRQDGKIEFATIDIPFGTVTLTDTVNAKKKPNEDFGRALDRVVAESVRPELVRRLKLFPVLGKRQEFFWVGGAVWAVESLTHVDDDSSAFLPLKSDEVQKLQQRLKKSPTEALNPSLDGIADPGAKGRASQQLAAVRAAFSADNVAAGAKLIEVLTRELNLQKKRASFSRYGSWLLGYLYSKS
jgi:tetratricopeptide (TPR) repeat protein